MGATCRNLRIQFPGCRLFYQEAYRQPLGARPVDRYNHLGLHTLSPPHRKDRKICTGRCEGGNPGKSSRRVIERLSCPTFRNRRIVHTWCTQLFLYHRIRRKIQRTSIRLSSPTCKGYNGYHLEHKEIGKFPQKNREFPLFFLLGVYYICIVVTN